MGGRGGGGSTMGRGRGQAALPREGVGREREREIERGVAGTERWRELGFDGLYGLIWALPGLDGLTDAVLYKLSTSENRTINRGGYFNSDRLG